MKIVRASEISTYQFCHRAWWYQQQGYEPDNQADMAVGTEIHEKHGRVVLASNCIQIVAYGLLLLAILMATIWFIKLIL